MSPLSIKQCFPKASAQLICELLANIKLIIEISSFYISALNMCWAINLVKTILPSTSC